MPYLFIAYFFGFAIYHLTKSRPVKSKESLSIDVIYKPINRGEYVEFEDIK